MYSVPFASFFNTKSPNSRLTCSYLPLNPKDTPLFNHTVFNHAVGFAEKEGIIRLEKVREPLDQIIVETTVTFTKDMPFRVKKETFLANDANKHCFVSLLKDTLNDNGIEAIQAEDDADLLIVQTAVAKYNANKTVVFGEDTDLLVLLCHHAKQNQNAIFFTSDKQATTKAHKIWDISKTKSVIGEDLCYQLPFIHAMTGCDTTSRLFGIDEPFALKKIKTDVYLQEQAKVFISKLQGHKLFKFNTNHKEKS